MQAKRWTKTDLRVLRRCFPYFWKWERLRQLLSHRHSWEEIIQKAEETRGVMSCVHNVLEDFKPGGINYDKRGVRRTPRAESRTVTK